MKRLFALLIILVTIVCSLSAADDYSFPFTLVLKRNGTDSVWFTKSATDKETDKISLHIFPIISASSTTTSSVESTVYLHWLKQSSNKVKIKITFVGNEEKGDDSTTFMMWCASEKDDSENEDKGINFNVVIKDADNKEIGSLTFDSAAGRLTKKSDAERSITFNPAETTTTDESTSFTYTSPLSIKMTINPASKDTDSSYVEQWGVDIQFVGYIKATIIAAT